MAPRSDAPLLEVHDLACRRGGRILFRGLSFALNAGESIVLTGPNGVGKSSLIRQVGGLLPVFDGHVERRCDIALADERAALDPALRLHDALAFWGRIDGIPAEGVDAAAARFGLSPLLDVPVRMLSTGQRKRAALARTAASGSPLWLLDEPGNGLDGAALASLGAAMDDHLAGGGAILAASHFDLPHVFVRRIDLAVHRP